MKLARSSSNTPSPQAGADGPSMSLTVGTGVCWSQHRNSAFYPVRHAADGGGMMTPEVPPSFPAAAAAAAAAAAHMQHMPYGFINGIVPMSPYLWPLMLPYSPLAAPSGHALAGQPQQFSPDRASVDAAGQTPEKAKFGK